MYLNFDVKRNTHNSKSEQVKVKFFPTTVALCTFNKIKKNERSLSYRGKTRYNALNTSYRTEKGAIYNTPTVTASILQTVQRVKRQVYRGTNCKWRDKLLV